MTVKEWLLQYVGSYEPSVIVMDGLTLVGPDWSFVCAVAILCVLIISVFKLAHLFFRRDI